MHTSDETKQRSGEYINESDDLLSYLNNNSIKTNSEDFIPLKDFYNIYKFSSDFLDLPKEERRKRNYKWFWTYFEKHRTLKKNFKSRHRYYVNGNQVEIRTVLINYKIQECQD